MTLAAYFPDYSSNNYRRSLGEEVIGVNRKGRRLALACCVQLCHPRMQRVARL